MYNPVDFDRVLGIYKPSFFYMELDVETEFDGILKNRRSESVFFHEYVHFLQDVLTIFGINNTRNILLLLHDGIYHMQRMNNTIKSLPLMFNSKIKDDSRKISQYTYGINDKEKYKKINDLSKIMHLKDSTKYFDKKPIKIYHISFGPGICDYQFGTRDIKEGMAYLIQKWVFGADTPSAPVCPYKIIQLLVNYICPYSFPEDIYLIALCELCLNCANPAMFFIETLEIFANEKYIPRDICDFEKRIQVGRKIECNNVVYDDFNVLYCQLIDELIFEMNKLFYDSIFDSVKSWLETLFINAKKINTYESLPITMFFINNGINNFHNLISSILGTPIIYIKNNKRGYYFDVHNSSDDLFFLRVLERFNNSLYYGTSCWLDEYCREICKLRGIDDYTNKDCRKYSSRRIGLNYNCPFSYFCQLFGLPKNAEFKNYAQKPNFA
jgi:hypothetical protein